MRALLLAALALCAAPALAVRPGEKARVDARRFGLDRFERSQRRAPDQGAKNAFDRFNARGGGRWRVRFDPRTGLPAAITDGLTTPRPGKAGSAARGFLQQDGGVLGVDANDLDEDRSVEIAGSRHVLFRQKYRGLPVEFASVKVHMDDHNAVVGANSTYEPNLRLNTTPSVPAPVAARAAENDARGQAFGNAELVVLPMESTGRAHLAWKLRVRTPGGSFRYYVDAHTGQVLFRYNNLRFAVCLTTGVVQGAVYDVDPSSTPGPVNRRMMNQYVYIKDGTIRATTVDDATFGKGFFCGTATGKVFMSLQGPYVNVANFRGPSAHYDNGSGVWSTVASPISSAHPYPPNATTISSITLPVSMAAVKFLPVFNNFHVGDFSGGDVSDVNGGDITDDDQLTIVDINGDPVASYVGTRGAFNGAAVAGKEMGLVLKANGQNGSQNGYDVTLSSWLALSSPGSAGALNTASHVWVTTDTNIGLRGEISLFYHLNQMHDYFFGDVNITSAAQVNRPVVAMAHVGPNMLNAFYNPDYDNLFFGDVNSTSPQDLFTDDATVSHHEYTHYMVEKIWSIQNFGQAGAISEGIADYFSASSLDDSAIGQFVVGGLGGSGALREIDCQKPGQTCKVLSNTSWTGEIHDDSIFLSQALWDIRRDRRLALGNVTGQKCADGLVWQSLFFFPESFSEFYDAIRLVDARGSVAACGGASTAQATINTAFATHGIILTSGDSFERNDGFETATDVSTRPSVSATIYPSADTDFYTFGSGPGLLKVDMTLPPSGGYFKAYQMKLYDSSRRLVASAAPPINGINTIDGLCETLDCTTTDQKVTLQYNVATGGQYYLQVAGGDALGGSNSGVQSLTPYSLSFTYPQAGAFGSSIVSAVFDQDVISFDVEVTTMVRNQDWRFSGAQLRDHAFHVLPNTSLNFPNLPTDYLIFQSSSNGLGHITGSVKLSSGFATRFPSIGTVELEVMGYNVHGSTASLGLSNPLNLTASGVELTAYNNLFNPNHGEKTTIKYAIANRGRTTIKLFTNTGLFVATLLDADMPAGKGSLDWDGRNASGTVVASGIYIVRIVGPGISKSQKIAIIK